jgi:arsenate reductase-like glutaredoxin family protein
MERYELEEKLEQIIAASGVSTEEIIETLERMLERYNEDLES